MSWLVEMVGQADSTSEDMNKRKKNGQSKLERQLWYLIAFLMGAAFIYMMFKAPQVEAKIKASLIDPSSNAVIILVPVTPTPDPTQHLSPTVERLIIDAFKDKGPVVVDQALRIARCESGHRENAENLANKNKSRDDGIFQINSIHGINPRFLKDARVNIAVAREIYDDRGWAAWVCARKLGIVK